MSFDEPTDEPTQPEQGATPPPWTPPPATPPGYGAPPTPPAYGAPVPPQAPGGFQQPGYQQPGYPPQGYPPAGYPPGGGYGVPVQQEHPQGTTILVLGILSILCCGLIGPVAWIMGNKAIAEIDAQPGRYSNRGSVQAGRIIGIVATALLILTVLGYLVLIAVAAGTSSTSG